MNVTKAQLAALLGVAPGSLPRLVSIGMPGPVVSGGGRGKASQFDAVACCAWQRQQLTMAGASSTPRDDYLRALTARAELELARRRDELIPVAEARAELASLATTVKARFRAIPDAVAPELEGQPPAVIKARLLERIDDVLRELARLDAIAPVGADEADS